MKYAIVDLQFGSTGKGLFAHFLAMHHQPTAVMSAFGPNAGHTSYIGDEKFVHTMVPMGALVSSVKEVFIGPGSIVNPSALYAEWSKTPHHPRILIHENAAFVRESDGEKEAGFVRIGSTMKGTAEAVMRKMRRDPEDSGIARVIFGSPGAYGWYDVLNTEDWLRRLYDHSAIQIEGAQGYSLSMHHGFWPYTTSRDVTIHQLLSDVAYPASLEFPYVYGCCRTYPIRVANRYDKNGKMIGTSGPCYTDQLELDWSHVGVEPELTTVTQLPRRIFSWSSMQITQAIRMNGVDEVFLNFVNYLKDKELNLGYIEDDILAAGAHIGFLGHGPRLEDIKAR